MTTRNRRSGRRSGTRRRTGRNVWVNQSLNFPLSGGGITAVNLLDSAADFMTFDTTIVAVIVTDLHVSYEILGSGGFVSVRVALQTAPSMMDSADFETLFINSIGPPWMWTRGRTSRNSIGDLVNLDFTPTEGTRIKAKRRFRENDSTLFLVIQSLLEAGTTIDNANMIGMFRTLLHIP